MIIEEKRIEYNGHELLFRSPREEDGERLLAYLKTVCGETPFLVREPEDVTMTIEQEADFIRHQNESDTALMVMVFYDGEFAGNGTLSGSAMPRYRHRVDLAIALFQRFTGKGIGTKAMEFLLQTAREKGWEQVELEADADNTAALALYRKMGFTVCGTMPFNMKYKNGTYATVYRMIRRF